MDLSDKINYVLGLKRNPSEKIGLISLIISEKEMTTTELNSLTNCHKTYDNYLTQFREDMMSKLVKTVVQRDYRGTKRTHFVIDKEILEQLISDK